MQELMELEAANTKSIEDVIEEERRQVEAKTPITEQVSGARQALPPEWVLCLLLIHTIATAL
jgi:hypothetical protein